MPFDHCCNGDKFRVWKQSIHFAGTLVAVIHILNSHILRLDRMSSINAILTRLHLARRSKSIPRRWTVFRKRSGQVSSYVLNPRHLRKLETSTTRVCIGSKTRVHFVDIMKQAEDRVNGQLVISDVYTSAIKSFVPNFQTRGAQMLYSMQTNVLVEN